MNRNLLRKMMREDLTPLIKNLDVEFYDVEYTRRDDKNILTFYIEKKEGLEGFVSVDECESVNDLITDKLDELDPIKEAYYLEIASLDIDTPFTRDRDYRKNIGNIVIVNLYKSIDNKKEIKGKLIDFTEDKVSIETKSKTYDLERSNISSIKLSIFD
ncbi:MAG: ribosome maturation factor RimP [Finegoldia sp.]|nr:ribosome maturation factor RimP [Finegoldia sp.]